MTASMNVRTCNCNSGPHQPRLIVVTGGPGAGKTALLEVVRRHFCAHVLVLPEAASTLFGGGFLRHPSDIGRRAAQRAIFHVQRELESIVVGERLVAVALCDRGTIDGAAYWPGTAASFFAEVGTTREAELARYDAVIHLRTPTADGGYDHSNRVRTESAEEAAQIDERIFAAWDGHPRRYIVENRADFMEKVRHALEIIEEQIPDCCARSAEWLVGAAAH
jgi:predicted ATPase